MMRARTEYKISTAVALGFALTLPLSASAQAPSGPGLSSGSGAGTGTGSSSTIGRNPSSSVSGVGPSLRVGTESGGRIPAPGYVPLQPPGFSVPLGPGATTTFPDDTTLFPFSAFSQEAGRTVPSDLSMVQPRELTFAESITDPGDRSLTFHKIALVAIFNNSNQLATSSQLHLAHRALSEAATAALRIQDPVIHDLRLVAVINAMNNLSEALLREGKEDLSLTSIDEEEMPIEQGSEIDRGLLIRRAELQWKRGAHLANRILNPTYRSEMLYRVVDSQAFGSQTIVNEFPHDRPKASSEEKDAAEKGKGNADGNENSTVAEGPHPFDVEADKILVEASEFARQIARPVWRDRALVVVASAAALSKQYARGLQVARLIPQPEVRSDALLKIAESQARRNDPDGATATYHEAALAVASMPLDDPRSILAGVLIDNLISVGRFEDARRSVVLYPDMEKRLEALGAVAESQGFRGASESAIEWIASEVPPEHRPLLYRRLRFGTLAAIEQNRSRDLTGRDR